MKYEKFSELWDEYMPKTVTKMNAEPETIQALIEYGRGDTKKIDDIRRFWKTMGN